MRSLHKLLALGLLGHQSPVAEEEAEAVLLWSEDHETADTDNTLARLPNWYLDQTAPTDDSADAGAATARSSSGGSQNQAHTGSWSMRTSISVTATAQAGCRTNYRVYAEDDPTRDLYYGAWYYIPQTVAVGGFWQNMQFKCRNLDDGTTTVAFGLYIYNPNEGEMAYRLTYKLSEDAGVAGPFSGGSSTEAYSEDSDVLVPAAEWFHVEAYLKPASDYTGQIIVRLNGTEIFNWNNVVTMESGNFCNAWHITNYGKNLGVNTLGDGAATIVLYNDDETIGEGNWIYGSDVEPWSGEAATPEQAAAEFAQSLVSFWALDESSGNRSDQVNSLTLTDNNTVTSDTGKVYSLAALFAAANDESLSIADTTTLDLLDTQWWGAAWVYLADKSASRVIFSKFLTTGNQRSYRLSYASGVDRFQFGVSGGGGTVVSINASNFGSPTVNTWYLVTCYHDSVNDLIGIAVNNGAFNTVNHTAGVFDSTAGFRIGRTQTGEPFDGRIGPVMLGNNYLPTSDDWTWLYNNGDGQTYADFEAL